MTLLCAWAVGAVLVFLVLAFEELRGAATSLDEREGRWVWLIILVAAVGWPLWFVALVLIGLVVAVRSLL